MLFLFGMVLSNEVFRDLRVLMMSRSPQSEFAPTMALDSLTALAFMVFSTLTFLHLLIWTTSAIANARRKRFR